MPSPPRAFSIPHQALRTLLLSGHFASGGASRNLSAAAVIRLSRCAVLTRMRLRHRRRRSAPSGSNTPIRRQIFSYRFQRSVLLGKDDGAYFSIR